MTPSVWNVLEAIAIAYLAFSFVLGIVGLLIFFLVFFKAEFGRWFPWR